MRPTTATLICLSVGIVGVACTAEIDSRAKRDDRIDNVMKVPIESYAGYQGTPTDWVSFLSCWDEKIGRESLRNDPATEFSPLSFVSQIDGSADEIREKVAAIQSRLNIVLPQSYIDFALATDAQFSFFKYYGSETDDNVSNFLPIDELERFESFRPIEWRQWRDAASETIVPERYFRYRYSTNPAEAQDSAYFPKKHLDELIVVGEIYGHGYILLNPMIITTDGEMEAWDLSWSAPGATRYRSFAELMQNLCVADVGDQDYGSPYPSHVLRSHCSRILHTVVLSE